MYKVFIFDKLIILSGEPLADINFQHCAQIEVTTRKAIKIAYSNFINTPGEQILILYNNENEKRLLDEFISLFWYVEAAGGIVTNDHNEKLFIHRFGRWDLPKGKIERNETKTQAAIREVQEETGLNEVSIIKELTSTFHIFDHKGKKVLKRTYWFLMHFTGNSVPKPQLEEEITEAVWIPDSQIDQIYKNTYSSIKSLLSEVIREV